MATETLSPDTLIINTYDAGTVTDIQDDPASPDANWLTVLNADASANVHMSFPTPSIGDPSGTQTFRIYIRKYDATGGKDPTYSVYLYENGSLVSTLASAVIMPDNATGVELSFTWDASLITSAADVELFFQATGAPGGPNARTIELGAAAWDVVAPDPAARRIFYFM